MTRRLALLFAFALTLSGAAESWGGPAGDRSADAAAAAAENSPKAAQQPASPAEAADSAFDASKASKTGASASTSASPVRAASGKAPGGTSTAWKRTPLGREIEKIIEGTPLAESRLGIEVVSLETGKVVYARNADELLNPASNAKLFTSAAALAILGPGFRFSTEFFADIDPHDKAAVPPAPVGKSKGKARKSPPGPKNNLYVRGGGDPTMTTEKLWGVVNELYDRGLRAVTGDIVLEENFFDHNMVGEGFDQETSDRAYMAPPASLTLNWNSVGIHVWPALKSGENAFVAVSPESDFIEVDSKVTTHSRRSARRLSVTSKPSEDGKKQTISLVGRLPVGSGDVHVWRKIDHPGLYFGHTLKRLLKMRGIQVKGEIRMADVPASGVTLLAVHQSETLAGVLKHVNKSSSNIVAEALVKTLGAAIYGRPGTWKKGLYAIERYLDVELGMKPGTYVMKNGSGLNDVNRFSAHQVNRVLTAMWRRFPTSPEFMSSMGIAGMDGTVQFRMAGTAAEGRLRAKTGTLENVTALSGYVQNVGGEKLAFSIIANDFPVRSWKVVPLMDDIGAAIAGQGNAASKNARSANLASSLTPLRRLGKEMAELSALASSHDQRNQPVLFQRLGRERDPAMKALVADAIFQNAGGTDSADAARVLLRHFDDGDDCLGRLSQAALQESRHTPLIDALGQLASDGNADALARLTALSARPEKKDPAAALLKRDVDDAMVEVSFAAPSAVFGALKNLPDEEGMRRAVSSLAANIRRAEKEASIPDPEDKAVAEANAQKAGSKGLQDKKRRGRGLTDELGEVVPHPFPKMVRSELSSPKSKAMRGASAAFVEAMREAFDAGEAAQAQPKAQPSEAKATAETKAAQPVARPEKAEAKTEKATGKAAQPAAEKKSDKQETKSPLPAAPVAPQTGALTKNH